MQRMWTIWCYGILAGTAAAISASTLPSPAFACSISGVQVFRPTLERFKPHPGAAQINKSRVGDYWEKVPAPVVEVTKIVRGTVPPGHTCDDAGILTLTLRLPPSSSYSIEQFAVYFRVLEGKLPDEIFPDLPLIGRVEDKTMVLVLAWLDGSPAKQIRLDLKVEAFLVTNGLDIGPSTVFTIKD